MVRAGVRGHRRLPAVAGSESAKPACAGRREDAVDLGQMIPDAPTKIKRTAIVAAAT
jgi:hypothetical protein